MMWDGIAEEATTTAQKIFYLIIRKKRKTARILSYTRVISILLRRIWNLSTIPFPFPFKLIYFSMALVVKSLLRIEHCCRSGLLLVVGFSC
jgi:hypothetical protein